MSRKHGDTKVPLGPCGLWGIFGPTLLRARHTDCLRTLVRLHDGEGDLVTLAELVEGYALELGGVEEEVCATVFRCDETKSAVCEALDSTVHTLCLMNLAKLGALQNSFYTARLSCCGEYSTMPVVCPVHPYPNTALILRTPAEKHDFLEEIFKVLHECFRFTTKFGEAFVQTRENPILIFLA